MNFIKNIKNKKGMIMTMDVVVAVVLLNFISVIFFSAVSYFYTNLNFMRDEFYSEILLTECAESIQWFRYWEWDKNNESGWDNFRTRYPTWMYYLAYDQANSTWWANPIMTPGAWSFHIQDLQTVRTYDLDRTWSGWSVEVINVDTNSTKNNAFRMFFIDTNSANQVMVRCYLKYNFNTKWWQTSDWSEYKDLKFTLMNYL